MFNKATLQATCQDCYLYARGGIGFEFEVTSSTRILESLGFQYDIGFDVPTGSLTYIKLWVDAGLTFSLNPAVTIFGSTSTPFEEPVINVWLGDTETRNVDLLDFDVQKSPYNKAKKILEHDLIFTVSCFSHAL